GYANPRSDVIVMLFGKKDNAKFAAQKPLIHEPGTHWHYSSGTTNILCSALREEIGGDYCDYLRFPYQELFHKIGMYSALFETDGTGTFVGSSFLYATARDWARFGQLYLQDGVWNGERILPEGWIEYSLRRTKISRQQRYGAHFWLPQPNPPGRKEYVPVPKDLYYLSGHYGQYVSIIPSKKLVVVRMGQTDGSAVWNQYLFLDKILDAINSE
ncbi:serine hydrolase, partial [candidate division KSB1 bacterium]|nr:serine hydrolase [candidate division KSB1 bacterium]